MNQFILKNVKNTWIICNIGHSTRNKINKDFIF